MTEKWKEFYPKYFVNHRAEIKSLARGTERLMKPRWEKKYQRYKVLVGGRKKRVGYDLGILVAKMFLDNPFNDSRIVYLDKNRKNCRADNIMWFTCWAHKERVKKLRLSAETNKDCEMIIKFMEGDKNALDNIFKKQIEVLPKILRAMQPRGYVDIDGIAQDAVVRASCAIRRGLLKNGIALDKWFKTIAKHLLFNELKKNSKLLSDTQLYRSNDEYNLIDKYAVCGLDGTLLKDNNHE